MSATLVVNEIFRSVQGESSRVGLPCVLVRLTGCNLRCQWCDTTHAWLAGEPMSIEDIVRRVGELGGQRVLVTGGEPLCQEATPQLLERFCEADYETMLETNGTVDITAVDQRVRRIVDVKCPSSQAAQETCWANLDHLGRTDEVKFVIADRADYQFARRLVREHGLTHRCEVIFSPVWDNLPASELAEWILADGLDVRLGVQLHKVVWPDRLRGV